MKTNYKLKRYEDEQDAYEIRSRKAVIALEMLLQSAYPCRKCTGMIVSGMYCVTCYQDPKSAY